MSRGSRSPDDVFPRTSVIGSVSPVFWAANKDRYLRQLLIHDIQRERGRDLIVIFHDDRFAEIDDSDIRYLGELLTGVETSEFDLLLETAGGYSSSTDALLEVLDNTKKPFHAIIVSAAKSNGTLLALGAKSLTMGYASQLGPIDPQLFNVSTMILKSDEIKMRDPVIHAMAEKAIQYQQGLAKVALGRGLMRDRDEETIGAMVEKLCSFNNHGAVIDIDAAREMFKDAVIETKADSNLWKQLWLLYCIYKNDMEVGRIAKLYEGKLVSASIKAPPPRA
jgi:hypothetical protein